MDVAESGSGGKFTNSTADGTYFYKAPETMIPGGRIDFKVSCVSRFCIVI